MSSANRSKLVSSIMMMVIFATTLSFALLVASRAWFGENRNVSATGMTAKVANASYVNATYEIFNLNMNALEDGTLNFIPAIDDPNTSDIDEYLNMPAYDIDNPVNIYKLLCITLEVAEGSQLDILPLVRMTAKTEATYCLADGEHLLVKYDAAGNRLPLKEGDAAPEYDNSVTSILTFYPISMNDATVVTATDGSISSVSLGEPTADAARKSFVEPDPDKPNKYKIAGQVIDLYTTTADDQYESPVYDENGNPVLDDEGNPVTKTKARFFILVAYDEALLNEVFSENIGNPALTDSATGLTQFGGIRFVNDFEFIISAKQ